MQPKRGSQNYDERDYIGLVKDASSSGWEFIKLKHPSILKKKPSSVNKIQNSKDNTDRAYLLNQLVCVNYSKYSREKKNESTNLTNFKHKGDIYPQSPRLKFIIHHHHVENTTNHYQ